MIRILIFLIVIVLAAAGITGLAGLSGRTAIRIGETLIDVHSGLFLGLIATALFLTIATTLIGSGLWRMPGNIARRREDRRRAKGMIALTRGLEAVAAGDAVDAQRHARLAMKQLDEPGVTRLLTAQAAQLAGDEETAGEAFSAMLEAPETEFLGLRGLFLQAMAAGDRKQARDYAERAFHLRPGAEWAYNSVFQLNTERGAWGDALEALQVARQHGLETGDRSKRREAVLLTAQAYAAEAGGDTDTASREALSALKKAPGFAPAAVLAAQLEAAAGRRSKAGRLLDEAWAVAPHPAISRTMAELFADETPERRSARLRRLADQAPEAEDSILLQAEQDIEAEEFDAARIKLEPLLTKAPRARTFAAMAAAMRGLYGPDAGQFWLDRAAAAPLESVPGADGVFHFTRDGWLGILREYGDHGRLAPPPLEEIHTGISYDDLRLLTAPPEEPATDTAETSDEANAEAATDAQSDNEAEDESDADDGSPEAPIEQDEDAASEDAAESDEGDGSEASEKSDADSDKSANPAI
ncbi:MAG: heme biosynthesis HemY N-terminal domain-containing protein [Parvularcula sp.]